MILSHACEYGVQALIHLNAHPPGTYVPVREIASAQNISPTFLSKIVRQLVTSRLLRSVKGPGGGVCLSRPAREIMLMDIVRAIDGTEGLNRCLIGDPRCHDSHTCQIHSFWKPIRNSIHRVLSKHSLSDLSRVHTRPDLRPGAKRRRSRAINTRNKGA